MKRMLLFMFVIGLSKMAFAAGSEPGNWKWKHNDGTDAAPVNAGIVLSHAQDVIRLRFQFYSGSLVSSAANGRIFLQYCDAGDTATRNAAAKAKQNWQFAPSQRGGYYPILNSITMGDASVSDGTYNRFSANARASKNDNGTAALGGPSSGLAWYTIADSGVIHVVGHDETDSVGAAFVMSNPDRQVIAQGNKQYILPTPLNNTSDELDTANTGGLLQLGAPYRLYRRWRLNSVAEQYYTSRNGNIAGDSVGNYYVAEFEFRFKAAYDYKTKQIIAGNLKPGHRYFFRVRSWGSSNTVSSSNGSNRTGFSSAYGGNSDDAYNNGAWQYADNSGGTRSSRTDTNHYVGYGDYHAITPMPYLDVDANFYPNTLPVRYSKELTATVSNGSVLLSWATAQEVNNKLFAVQRSTDGVNYTTIGTVASKAANGNSTAPLSYGYTDASPAGGTNYYRLSQVNLDGTSELGRVVSATIGGGANTSELYPNPAGSYVNVSNMQVGSFYKIINSGGQVVGSGIATSTLQTIPVSNLASGVYFVQFSSQVEGTKTLKFLKK